METRGKLRQKNKTDGNNKTSFNNKPILPTMVASDNLQQ